ncbi:hypothetical protein cypCar_00040971 [Cyprinus carpio]|nr:hypothetical protein cypCar_00040971 [Cyprinus carpio]
MLAAVEPLGKELPANHLLKCTQVGRIKCPLLLVNGDDDQTFPVVESAEDAPERKKAGGHERWSRSLKRKLLVSEEKRDSYHRNENIPSQ